MILSTIEEDCVDTLRKEGVDDPAIATLLALSKTFQLDAPKLVGLRTGILREIRQRLR